MIIIGITGTLGAGKGTAVDYLVKNRSFKHYSIGDYLKDKLKERNLEATRDNLRNIGNEIRTRYGADYIAKKLFQKAKKQGSNAIIESIRSVRESEFIKFQNGGVLIAVDADPKLRYKRIQKRGAARDGVTFKEFLKQEKKESQSKDPNSQNLPGCISLADYRIDNNGTINEFNEKVEKVITKIS